MAHVCALRLTGTHNERHRKKISPCTLSPSAGAGAAPKTSDEDSRRTSTHFSSTHYRHRDWARSVLETKCQWPTHGRAAASAPGLDQSGERGGNLPICQLHLHLPARNVRAKLRDLGCPCRR